MESCYVSATLIENLIVHLLHKDSTHYPMGQFSRPPRLLYELWTALIRYVTAPSFDPVMKTA